jgi:S-DNA-T family DNA segregation ATPase FtsK/SpoIIIE
VSANSDEKLGAADFNFWCAVNSKPFRLAQHAWPDGSVEWDIEVFPGRPEATVAYGTAQTDENLAAIAAFAFAAGVEWGETFARGAETELDEGEERLPGIDDEPGEVAAPAQVTEPEPRPEGDQPKRYRLPPIPLLQQPPPTGEQEEDEEALAATARALEGVLRNFKVRGEIMEVHQGPVVTLYEFEPMPGTKSSTVINLADDIARSMRCITTRIAVVPGRSVMGIELPNPVRETVYLREIL